MDSTTAIIGQEKLLKKLNSLIDSRRFPRCSMFIGPEGSGRKTIAKYVADKLSAECVIAETKIDSVRQVIELAHKSHIKTVYVFPDVEKMSINAENALLKLLEEPPNNAYFIITAQSEFNALTTIRSRSVVFRFDNYTVTEITDYCVLNEFEDSQLLVTICETPGEVQKAVNGNVRELYDYAKLVVDNIAEVSGANALKIGSKIAFKDTDTDKFDLMLFLKAFKAICAVDLTEIYANWVLITSKYMHELNIRGVNKSMLFDSWVLDCRAV